MGGASVPPEEAGTDIGIALDTYDDIFSDFDIRGYDERAISRDFLDELRLRLRRHVSETPLAIVLLIPISERSPQQEGLILERLASFFQERKAYYRKENRRTLLTSLLLVAIGLGLAMGANLLVGYPGVPSLLSDFLLIPAWFFVWNGLELLIKNRREISRKGDYYGLLRGARLEFRDREGVLD